jgi:hypothetical protein
MHRRSLNKILFIWVFVIASCLIIGKASIASDNGQTSADFLNIGVGARAAALGGAFTSVTDGPSATYWNPGGLSSVENTQILLSHFSWYQDLNYEYFSAARQLGDKVVLAVSLSYLNYGSIEGYDQYDNPTGELNTTFDLAGGLTGCYKFSDKFSAGLTLKYIHQSLAGIKGSAFAADIGGIYHMNDKITFGLTAANLGTDIEFDGAKNKLPASIRLGLMFIPFGSWGMTSLELEKQLYGEFAIKNGFELRFEDRYFIRGGYALMPGEEDRKFAQSPSLGLGAIFGPATIDYTFSPKEKISSESIHRFTVQFGL